jgi:archaellum component FlaC
VLKSAQVAKFDALNDAIRRGTAATEVVQSAQSIMEANASQNRQAVATLKDDLADIKSKVKSLKRAEREVGVLQAEMVALKGGNELDTRWKAEPEHDDAVSCLKYEIRKMRRESGDSETMQALRREVAELRQWQGGPALEDVQRDVQRLFKLVGSRSSDAPPVGNHTLKVLQTNVGELQNSLVTLKRKWKERTECGGRDLAWAIGQINDLNVKVAAGAIGGAVTAAGPPPTQVSQVFVDLPEVAAVQLVFRGQGPHAET